MIRMVDVGRIVSYLEEKGAKASKCEVAPRSKRISSLHHMLLEYLPNTAE